MEIKAVRMFDGGFMTQAFAFGGERQRVGASAGMRKKTGGPNPVMEGLDKGDDQIIYRASLQNFLIDTGEEVILVDTGFKSGFSSPAKMLGAPLFMGEKVADYMDSFAALGYKPEQVTRILVTHKHPDHTAALEYFPNAKVYISPEDADAMKLEGKNIIRVEYTDKYKNFPHAVQIIPGLWFIEAKGHTYGNSIVVLEHDGLYYMFQGDITYTDAALKANKLSIVFEDIKAARETLDRVRAFVRKHPTVYLSTHCPEGYENLELKRVMRL